MKNLVSIVMRSALATMAAISLSACTELFEDEFEATPMQAPKITFAKPGIWQQPVNAELAAQLDQLTARWQNHFDVDELTLAIMSGAHGAWESQVSDPDKHLFWWASAGKLVTASLAHQLIEDGRLNLQTPANSFVENAPEAVTIEHLLHHTSGIESFERMGWADDKTGYITPDRFIAQALKSGPKFLAGENWEYSNTGYLILQKALEQASGKPYADLVSQHITQPLGLSEFHALKEHIPGDVTYPDLGDPVPALFYAPNVAGAGNIVASAKQMAQFWHATMSGQFVSANGLNHGQQNAHTFYGNEAMLMGAGVITYIGSGDHGAWFGHGGGSEQVGALVIYSPSKQLVMAIAGIGDSVPTFDIMAEIVAILDAA